MRAHEPLVGYQINRQLSGWILPPLVMRAFGALCHNQTYAPQQKRPCLIAPVRLGLSQSVVNTPGMIAMKNSAGTSRAEV
jgi:hypothetical protein